MAMGSLDSTTVALFPGQMNMNQKRDMANFLITNWALEKSTFDNGNGGVKMIIVMKRKMTTEMMTTYFPTLLLTAITFATTFFKPFFFEAALSVNLTTMLVMTTIFIAVMDKLPSTAYIKMIDIWLIFGQLIPFARVVITTLMEQMREGQMDRLVNHHGTAMKMERGNSPALNVAILPGTNADLKKRHQLRLAPEIFPSKQYAHKGPFYHT